MRKRTLISLILTIVMILTASGIASAASWKYYFPITISDNSSTTRTAYPIILEVGGQHLVDTGYMTANGTDARLRTTADKNLLMSTDNIVFVVDSLPSYGQVTYNLYTGYSPEIDAFQIIVGDGGYVTVADNTTIELGDNFTIEQSGWVDTSPTLFGWALDFLDTSSEKVTIADNASLDITSKLSIEFFVNIDTAFDNAHGLVAKMAGANDGYTARQSASGFQFFINGGVPGLLSTTGATANSTDTWLYVACTYDDTVGGNDAKIYVNGTLDNEANWGGVAIVANNEPLEFANYSAQYSDATMDEIRVSNIARTPTEISDIWNGGDPILFEVDANTVGLWHCDEGLGTKTYDETANNLDGTLTNTPTWVASRSGDVPPLVFKDDAFRTQTGVGGTGIINSQIASAAATVTATDVSSGEHTVTTSGNSDFLSIGEDIGANTTFPPASDNLVFNAPLWSSYLSASPFDSVDSYPHTCTVTNAVWSSDGYVFDGNNDEVVIPHNAIFNAGEFTVETWFYKSAHNSYAVVAGKLTGASGWRIRFTTSNTFTFDVHDGATYRLSGSSALADDVWVHAVGVHSNGAAPKLYVNTIPNVGGIAVGSYETNASNVWIGNDSGITTRGLIGGIGEVRIYDKALTQAEITANYNATKWKYEGSHTGDNFEYVYSGVSVPNTADNWIFMQNNVMPYADNITITVGGVQELWFEPNEMITSTTVPDRETATANDGTITWGSNDQVTIVFGSVTSYEATTSAATVNETGWVLPLVGIPDNWWGMEFDGEDLPFYPTFLDTSTQTGIPLQTLYLLMVFGAAIALATVTIVLTRSVVVGAAFYTVTMAYGANADIVAWWIIYVFLIMIIGIIFLSSRQAMGG